MNFVYENMNLPLPEDLLKCKLYGDFERERMLIDNYLNLDIIEPLKQRLYVERQIAAALPACYPLRQSQALALLRERLPSMDAAMLDRLCENRFVDWIYVNGERRFRRNIYSNLVAGDSPFTERDQDELDQRALLDRTITELKTEPCAWRFTVRASLSVTAPLPDSTVLRVHLPIAQPTDRISDVEIHSTGMPITLRSPDGAPQSTVYFETTAGQQRDFWVEYSFTNNCEYVLLPATFARDTEFNFDLDEQPPHISFTPYLKKLCAEIVGNQTNPLLKARSIYDYITEKVNYSFMRPYFTLDNIAEYGALNLKGDCGVQALLFITLCRIAGIPARWESGSFVPKTHVGQHDWARFYVEPFGWLFADCSFGGAAFRANNKLRHDFYFGNIDPFRLVSATGFQAAFEPKKNFLRYDPYDNQCGEAETDHRALFPVDYRESQTLVAYKKIK